MSRLYVWEFSEVVVRGEEEFPRTPGILQQTPTTIGQGVNQSSAFNAATAFIYITADQSCFIDIGTNVTLATFPIEQGIGYLFGVNPGDVIAVSGVLVGLFGLVTDDGLNAIVTDNGVSWLVAGQ